jgi:hypothetical protein
VKPLGNVSSLSTGGGYYVYVCWLSADVCRYYVYVCWQSADVCRYYVYLGSDSEGVCTEIWY